MDTERGEAALTNVLSKGDKILVLESGRFAIDWGNAAACLGVEVEVLVAAGKAANLAGERPVPSIARFRAASISDARGGNKPRCART
jgi:hypothetical protein